MADLTEQEKLEPIAEKVEKTIRACIGDGFSFVLLIDGKEKKHLFTNLDAIGPEIAEVIDGYARRLRDQDGHRRTITRAQ